MYAVVQHIRQSGTKAEGINAILHESKDDLQTIHYKQFDVTPPTNNSVESYLEIEYKRGTPRAAIQALLIALSQITTVGGPPPISLEQPGVGRAEFWFLPKYVSVLAKEWSDLTLRLLAMPL